MTSSGTKVSLARLRRRTVLALLLAVAAIYGLVRGLELDVETLVDYLLASALFVGATVAAALLLVSVIKLIRRR